MRSIIFIKKVIVIVKRILKDEATTDYSIKEKSLVYYAEGKDKPLLTDYKPYIVEDINWTYLTAACIRSETKEDTPNFKHVIVFVKVIPLALLVTKETMERRLEREKTHQTKSMVANSLKNKKVYYCDMCGGKYNSDQCENVVCPDYVLPLRRGNSEYKGWNGNTR
jgi:hypothetical protein